MLVSATGRHLRLLLVAAVSTLVAALFVALPARAVAEDAALPGPTGPLDHFLCYTAVSVPSTVVPGFKPPAAVLLKNQFNPNGYPARLRVVTTHCNPVEKRLRTGEVFKVQNPSWHLVCWSMVAGTSAKTPVVQAENQFGTAVLTTAPPDRLCLPSLKSEKTPPSFGAPGPNEVRPDHFSCYRVAYPAGTPRFTPPPNVRLRDQFTPPGTSFVAKIGAPTRICLPTSKTLPTGGEPTPITNPTEHLVCFAVTGTNPATLPRTVYDLNQFGTGAVQVTARSQELCLPTLKRLIG